jgi:Cu+-exporting ATPase
VLGHPSVGHLSDASLDQRGEDAMARDPVCGMQVDEHTAQQSEYEGHTYYFCSATCKQEFDRNPQRYAEQ